MKKRCALLYSGQPRDLKACYPNHKKMVIDANPQWDMDIFAHIWHDEGENLTQDKVHNPCGFANDRDIVPFIREHWRAKGLILEKPRRFTLKDERLLDDVWQSEQLTRREGFLLSDVASIVSNGLSQCYSLHQAYLLKTAYEEKRATSYDCVMRLRTDLYFRKPILLERYDLGCINVQELVHALPLFERRVRHISDIFAFGDNKHMGILCSLYPHVEDYLPLLCDDKRYSNERTLMHHLLYVHKVRVVSSVGLLDMCLARYKEHFLGRSYDGHTSPLRVRMSKFWRFLKFKGRAWHHALLLAFKNMRNSLSRRVIE
ncbi:MAG: hypothetical protein GDA54_01370 [Alphaproteobacteria bacterium GM7ARS4]|nr:hypothetical protein [Alphaproteobacteria bacterium GM7ARS4]